MPVSVIAVPVIMNILKLVIIILLRKRIILMKRDSLINTSNYVFKLMHITYVINDIIVYHSLFIL